MFGFALLCVSIIVGLSSYATVASAPVANQDSQSIDGKLCIPTDSASVDAHGGVYEFATEARFDIGQSGIGNRGLAFDGGVLVRSSSGDAWGASIPSWKNGESIELSCPVVLSPEDAAAMAEGESSGDEVHKMRFQLWKKLMEGRITLTDDQGVSRTYRIEPKTSIESWRDLRAISGESTFVSITLVPDSLTVSGAQ